MECETIRTGSNIRLGSVPTIADTARVFHRYWKYVVYSQIVSATPETCCVFVDRSARKPHPRRRTRTDGRTHRRRSPPRIDISSEQNGWDDPRRSSTRVWSRFAGSSGSVRSDRSLFDHRGTFPAGSQTMTASRDIDFDRERSRGTLLAVLSTIPARRREVHRERTASIPRPGSPIVSVHTASLMCSFP